MQMFLFYKGQFSSIVVFCAIKNEKTSWVIIAMVQQGKLGFQKRITDEIEKGPRKSTFRSGQ